MPDSNARAEQDRAGDLEPVADAVEQTESYETDEGVVFYDTENPLAWLQSAEVFDLSEVA